MNFGTFKDVMRGGVGNIRVSKLTGLTKKDVRKIRVKNVDGMGNGGLTKLSISKLIGVAKGGTGNMLVANLDGVTKSGVHKLVVDNVVGVAKSGTTNMRLTNLTGMANRRCSKLVVSKLLGIMKRRVGKLRLSKLTGMAKKRVGKVRLKLFGFTSGTGNLRVKLFGCRGRSVGKLRLKLIGTGPRAGMRLVIFKKGDAGVGMNTHFGGGLFCAVLNKNARCLSFSSGFSTTLFCQTNLRLPLCEGLFMDNSLNCRRVRAFQGGGIRNVPTHLCTLRTHLGLRCQFASGFNLFIANKCNNDHCCGGTEACSGNIVTRTKIILFWLVRDRAARHLARFVLGLFLYRALYCSIIGLVEPSPLSGQSNVLPAASLGPRFTLQTLFPCQCLSPSFIIG